ncbi:MAG: hypothetical protein CVU50_01825 [Candidatus Cloacimonetes bacterium HGW-Cloacimonetes-3]|jgi:predicted anti-sigma-YlaC factor YlaD|nr:MAG: hypothetical protein CVU50_01825 [Candidatus Cloacimonetes bacterium HGW-Cloacimonetes-3]
MRCSTAQRYIDLKLDGELKPRHLPVLTKHLSACKACQTRQADAARLQQILANAPAPEPPAWVHAQIMDKVQRMGKARPTFARRFQLSTATAVVAIFFSFIAGTQIGVRSFKTEAEVAPTTTVSESTIAFGENTLLDTYESTGGSNE